MSQAKVTDFFATRKRARQEDVLLGKEKKLKTLEPEILATRRSSRQIEKSQPSPVEILEKDEQVVALPLLPQQTVNTKQKVSVEELKQRIQNFNKKLQLHKDKYVESEDREVVDEEIKQVATSQPAFEKYVNLTSKENETKLILPLKYQNLYEMFKGAFILYKKK